MDTCGYERMEESSADADERQVVIYPMVTYDPDTVERHPEISGHRPRRVQQRILRCTFLICLTNAIVAAVCLVFASIAQSRSRSNYELCLATCCMVIVGTCFARCLRSQGKKIMAEGALEKLWTTRTFFCCFISMDVLAASSIVVGGIAVYVLLRVEVSNCSNAFYEIGDLETNPCTVDSETRYFMSILAVTLLTIMGILSLVVLGFSLSMARKFSFKMASESATSRVVVTKVDEIGRKVIYRHSSQHEGSPAVEV